MGGSSGSAGGSMGGGLPGADLPGAGLPGAGMPGAGIPGAGMPGAGMPGSDGDGDGQESADGDGASGSGDGTYGSVSGVGSGDGSGGSAGGVGGLDDEFDKSLGDFDDAILEEQQKVSQVGRDMGAFETGSQSGGSGGGMTSGGIIVANDSSSGGNSRGSPGQATENMEGSVDALSSEQIGERTPEDVPPGFDDDIVAKQLREAALAEEDPELRDRLWDEYRAYKGL